MLIIFLGDRAALGVGADARGEEHGDLRGAFDQVPASSTRERVVELGATCLDILITLHLPILLKELISH